LFDPVRKEFLLIFHKKLGKWLSPGGHVEVNESVTQAAIREVKEELGINVELVNIKGNFSKNGKDYRCVKTLDNSGSFCVIEEFVCPKGAWDPHIHVDHIFVSIIHKTDMIDINNAIESNIYEWLSLPQIEKINTFDNVVDVCKEIITKFQNKTGV
jgi:8-oxo-dGTP diphosphatase